MSGIREKGSLRELRLWCSDDRVLWCSMEHDGRVCVSKGVRIGAREEKQVDDDESRPSAFRAQPGCTRAETGIVGRWVLGAGRGTRAGRTRGRYPLGATWVASDKGPELEGSASMKIFSCVGRYGGTRGRAGTLGRWEQVEWGGRSMPKRKSRVLAT